MTATRRPSSTRTKLTVERDIERTLQRLSRQYAERARALEEASDRRDEMIRRARADGVTQARVMELTGLSRQRVNQIVRGTRR